jgi:hypothetical protein
MTSQNLLRLLLELDRGGEPISGRLCGERGCVRAFSGWLGLFAALEDAAAERTPPAAKSIREERGADVGA